MASSSSEIADLFASFHDQYFEIDRLAYSVERAEVRLPIFAGRVRKRWLGWSGRPPADPPPPPIGVVVVRNVTAVSVEDEAGIGWYDVSHGIYDSESGELRIVSNVPCEIVVLGRGLDVTFCASQP